ncbi:MAG: NAD(P)/FAD-dependent oxidoreductase [Rhodospirillales bacterium]|nr:NAD(P)/FAD-dependent oxidoreductase [Rhodospirillales bacterium]
MTNPPFETDVAIIGAGPTGLFAVFECGMLNLKCHVIEALDVVGGQCTALYPEKPIYDIPGYPNILAVDLVDRLREQAAPFEPTYHLGQQVVGLDSAGDGRWLVRTSADEQVLARAVIIAAGVGAFGPNRPPLDGIEAYEGKPSGSGVQYLVGRREDYRGRKIVIAGGGDSAVDWALSLAGIAAGISVVHRRAKFRAAPESARKLQELAEAGRIELVVPTQLAALEGDGGSLSAVMVSDLDGNERRLPADVLLAFYGLSQNLGPIAEWGLNLDHKHIAVDPSTCGTSLPGVFAIGDIATYPGKLKLILTGFSEAAVSAHAIQSLLFPEQVFHFEYSTTRGVPGTR